ncbi:MAG: serine O-acetyltransferase [Planctomycetota bacterium]
MSSQEPSKTPPPSLIDGDLVEAVRRSILEEPGIRHLGMTHLPSRDTVEELVDLIREVVFPGFFGKRGLTPDRLELHVQELLARIGLHAEEQIRSVLRYASDLGPGQLDSSEADQRARETTRSFLEQIPELRRLLALDVQAAYDGDPAARHPDETIFCYPGIEAIFAHRVAALLYRTGVPLLPRIIQEMAHSRSGIDIHPGAQIGESFFIDHGGAVVIGETTVIGDQVRIYQGVTLGAKRFDVDDKGRLLRDVTRKRHPTIGNRVTIYAGAVILGGRTEIGDDCVISGGVFVTESVPPGHVVRQHRPELSLRSHSSGMNGTGVDAGG